MKKRLQTLPGILSFVLFTACYTPLQSPNQKPMTKAEQRAETARLVRQRIDERRFLIDVSIMLPLRGMSQHISDGYYLEVAGDTIVSHLPYRGVARQVPYGGGKGLNFEGTITDYKASTHKKGRHRVELTVRNDEDTYLYQVDVFENGSASVHVHSRERESISFTGQMRK
ncbi:DUF4251 domain-containing protein [Prevotella sp.]|uniref:DUF4251 domain-containing protein n=1 Tax=Prevotella sp. TaxID=59823 RepID=UPI002F91D052